MLFKVNLLQNNLKNLLFKVEHDKSGPSDPVSSQEDSQNKNSQGDQGSVAKSPFKMPLASPIRLNRPRHQLSPKSKQSARCKLFDNEVLKSIKTCDNQDALHKYIC